MSTGVVLLVGTCTPLCVLGAWGKDRAVPWTWGGGTAGCAVWLCAEKEGK